MKTATITLLVSCLLAACGAELLPCAPDCSEPHTNTLFPNPHDCTKYFQCTGDFAIPRTCSDGLYFNAEIEICDYPESSGCTADPDYDCSSSTTPTTNVTAGFSTTVLPPTTTVLIETTTAEPPVTTTGNLFSTTITSPTIDLTDTTTEVEITTVVETTTAEPPVTTTGFSGTTTDSGECSPECPSDEALFPNPRDCASFYQCAFGIPFVVQCPEGQWYDALNERCDYISEVECNAGPDTPCIAVTNPTVEPPETTTVVAGPTTTNGGEDCVPPCPANEALYPNPRDCSSFFQCAFGVPHLMQCPPGQEYAAALERCDYPEVAQCTVDPDSPCVAVTNPPQ